jgi:hypothetical protein
MIEREFIPYDRALALKELGFEEECLAYYDRLEDSKGAMKQVFRLGTVNGIFTHFTLAPLYQQAFRWFREKYGLIGHIRESWSFYNTMEYVTQINGIHVNHGLPDKPVNRFDTYEEAENACIDKLIQLIKEAKEL